MSWFRKRKRKDEYEVFTSEIPITTMVRWFIHDVGYGDDTLDTFIGLPPISEEGNSKEAQDSSERLSELQPLVPFIDSMADIAANVLAAVALQSTDEDELPDGEDPDEMADVLATIYKSVSLATLIGTLSTASALGLIQITALGSDVQRTKKDGGLYE